MCLLCFLLFSKRVPFASSSLEACPRRCGKNRDDPTELQSVTRPFNENCSTDEVCLTDARARARACAHTSNNEVCKQTDFTRGRT